MNDFTWYPIFNLAEFEATGLVSREYSLVLEGVGLCNFLVTKGNLISVTYDDVMLSLGLTESVPFVSDGYGLVLSTDGSVYWGMPNAS